MNRLTIQSITPIILAGGLGTRLKSIMPGCPKVLSLINGRPFLSYLLDQLIACGFEEAILCLGYKAEIIQKEYGIRFKSVGLKYSVESSPLGTAGAVRNAIKLVKTNTTLVMNGDSYCDADIGSFFDWHEQVPERPSILLVEVDNSSRYGSVTIDKLGRITAFEEKKNIPVRGMINAGIYLIPTSLLKDIPANTNASFEKDIFPAWIPDGLYGLKTKSKFIDIGTPESLRMAGEFLEQRHQTTADKRQ